ncbi:MAG: cytochrome b5 domain-containing protein [Peptostreptococcaceae bacterium]|nr:cytochrome b5 domain-containing protein [Peptostreptococcaceae bacterium]
MKRRTVILAMALALSLSMTACGNKTEQNAESSTPPASTESQNENKDMENDTEQMEFTLEELAEFNGKDGKPAYIAVDGVVYDVTDLPAWKDGGHNGFEAGQDLTEAIKKDSPHGVAKLDGVPVVGTLK